MAKYRNIQFTFWTDSKIMDSFTPEDRYFYLYLMTNPHTSLCGCYEITLGQMALETGYQKEVINKLIVRFTENHDVIRYDAKTSEMLILNWHKYNWSESEKTMIGVQKGIDSIKNDVFKQYLENIAAGNTDVSIGYVRGIYAPTMPHVCPLYETFTFLSNNSSLNISDIQEKDIDKNIDKIKEIIEYFNSITGKKYKVTSKSTRSHINARLNEGFTVEDFKKVIETKNAEWKDDEKMCEFIRPETLFSSKFESYLNQKVIKKESQKDKLRRMK